MWLLMLSAGGGILSLKALIAAKFFLVEWERIERLFHLLLPFMLYL